MRTRASVVVERARPAPRLGIGLLAPAAALAQTGAAVADRHRHDQSGAAVPGATVTATNQATNVAYTAVSNEAGNYTITSLPVGTYVVKAELASFKTAATKPIQLEAMQIVRIDFKLELGSLEETVEVTGESPVLQTETATVGEVISGTTLQALPLNGRNTGQLSLLLPGVVTPNPGSFTGARNTGGGGRPYVNGNREQTNNYTIDGVDMNESIDNLVAYQPSPDALAEISVETNNYSADTGNVAGAVISNVIKSGTNRFRGNVFEFYRNSKMDANSWSNNRSNAAKPERRQDIFGGTLGGPIVKNKVFFFGNYQGTRFDAPGSETVSVAPEAWRRGDLSSVTATIRDPRTGQAFAGNQIPAGRISPIARRDPQQHGALSAARTAASTRRHRQLRRRAAADDQGRPGGRARRLERVEQRQDLRPVLVRRVRSRRVDKRAFPLLLGSNQDAPFRNLAFNWNRIFSSSLVNELLVGYNQIAIVNDTLDWSGIGNANATFGIAGGQPIAGLSSIGWGGGLTAVGAGASDSDTLDKHYQINEKLTWLKGRHSLKFGGQLLHYVQQRFYAGNNGLLGLFAYGGGVHRVRVLRLPARPGREQGPRQPVRSVDAPAQPHRALRPGRLQGHAGADAEPRDALGVHAAGRREGQPAVQLRPAHRRADLPGRQQPRGTRALQGLQEGLRAAARLRLAAGRPLGRSRRLRHLAVHGRHRRQPAAAAEPAVLLRIRRAVRRRRPGAGTLATGFAELRPLDQPSGQVRAWDPNLRPQFTQQWNVFAEYLLTPSMSANVGYVGHKANHLVTPVEGNQPLPGVGDPATWAPTQHAPSAVRDGAAHHQHLDDRGARPQRLQGAAGQPAPAQRRTASSTSRRTR